MRGVQPSKAWLTRWALVATACLGVFWASTAAGFPSIVGVNNVHHRTTDVKNPPARRGAPNNGSVQRATASNLGAARPVNNRLKRRGSRS
jgi:hypothetical protein